MSEEREDTFLIAITVTDAPTRMHARQMVYSQMPTGVRVLGEHGTIESWWDATVDATDGHDNGEAVWTHPGRGFEAQSLLAAAGLAPEDDLHLGAHPSVWTIRDGDSPDGGILGYQCERCGETADHPAVLAEVPCRDLSVDDHGHMWVSETLLYGVYGPITCASDCGMTIVNGTPIGKVEAP